MSSYNFHVSRLEATLAELNELAAICANSSNPDEVNSANQKRKRIIADNSLRALFKTYPREVQVECMAVAQRSGSSEFFLLYNDDKDLFIEKLHKLAPKQADKGEAKFSQPIGDLALLNDPKASDFINDLIQLNEIHKQIVQNCAGEISSLKKELREIISRNFFKAIYRKFSDQERIEVIEKVKLCKVHEYYAAYFVNHEKFIASHVEISLSKQPKALPESKSQARRHKEKAESLNVSVNEYKQTLLKKRTEVKKVKLNHKQEQIQALENISPPNHISLTKWNDYEAICDLLRISPEDPSSKRMIDTARSIEFQYITDKPEFRLETFKHADHDYMELSDIVGKVSSILSDTKMNDAETKFKTKVGSLKSQGYCEWVDKVYKLWQPIDFNPNKESLDYAIGELNSMLDDLVKTLTEDTYLSPIPLEVSLQKATKGRNSGYPFFTSKWHNDESILDYYMSEAKELLEGKEFDAPRILFSRTQYNGKTPKMRPVECPPKSEALAGKCFTSRILYAFKNHPIFCGFRGNDRIGDEMRAFVLKYDTLISSDFSNFDATCTHLIPIIFDLMDKVFGYQYSKYFDRMKEYYRKSILITPQGILQSELPNGLQSGDSWTSVIGTLANALSNIYTLHRMGIKAEFKSYGDDCVVGTNETFDISRYEMYMRELGMECNQSKQEISSGENRNCNFLGYYYFYTDCIDKNKSSEQLAIFPIMRALSGLIFREHFVTADDLFNSAKADAKLTEAELQAAKEANKAGIDLLGIISKFDNLRNHPDYDAFLMLFLKHHPTGCNPIDVFPFRNLLSYLRNVHRIFGKGLGTSYTFRKLVYHHNIENLIFHLNYMDSQENIVEFQTVVKGAERKHGNARLFICGPVYAEDKVQLALPAAKDSVPITKDSMEPNDLMNEEQNDNSIDFSELDLMINEIQDEAEEHVIKHYQTSEMLHFKGKSRIFVCTPVFECKHFGKINKQRLSKLDFSHEGIWDEGISDLDKKFSTLNDHLLLPSIQ